MRTATPRQFQSASSWGCELKSKSISSQHSLQPSASSWGCELKCTDHRTQHYRLLSASSWGCELKCKWLNVIYLETSQPLREAVSWNKNTSNLTLVIYCQPLREAVSWNAIIPDAPEVLPCQPLREAVSWNITKYYKTGIGQVSLFVRLWVEILC